MATKKIGKLQDYASRWKTAFNSINAKDRNVSGVIKIKAFIATDTYIAFLFDKKISDKCEDLYGELVRSAPASTNINVNFFTKYIFGGNNTIAFYPKVSGGKAPIKSSDLDNFFESIHDISCFNQKLELPIG